MSQQLLWQTLEQLRHRIIHLRVEEFYVKYPENGPENKNGRQQWSQKSEENTIGGRE